MATPRLVLTILHIRASIGSPLDLPRRDTSDLAGLSRCGGASLGHSDARSLGIRGDVADLSRSQFFSRWRRDIGAKMASCAQRAANDGLSFILLIFAD